MFERYELVEMVKGLNPIELPYYNLFKISYTYDESDKPYWIFAPYSLDVMEIVCAYIQVYSSGINLMYDIYPSDMLDIIKYSYEGRDLKTVISEQPHLEGLDYLNYSEIDLYVNWEVFAPLADRILEIDSLKKESLEEVLLRKMNNYFKKEE